MFVMALQLDAPELIPGRREHFRFFRNTYTKRMSQRAVAAQIVTFPEQFQQNIAGYSYKGGKSPADIKSSFLFDERNHSK